MAAGVRCSLFEDAASTWRDAVDVGWGALEMNLKMWSFPKLAVDGAEKVSLGVTLEHLRASMFYARF